MLCFPSNKYNSPLIAEVVSQHFLTILTLEVCYTPQTPAFKMACHFCFFPIWGLLLVRKPPSLPFPSSHNSPKSPQSNGRLVSPAGLEAPSHSLPISFSSATAFLHDFLMITVLCPRLPGENTRKSSGVPPPPRALPSQCRLYSLGLHHPTGF